MNDGALSDGAFDFDRHSRDAVADYLTRQDFFKSLAGVVGRITEECIRKRKIPVHSVQFRAKDPSSFGRKAALPSEENVALPKYNKPIEQITDLAGARVITQFLEAIPAVDEMINAEFDVIERSDKSERLIAQDKFGYQSVHYLVRLKVARSSLAEYERYSNSTVEIQVRTILQHAWAEIEHDIQYKSSSTIPAEIRRRFMALAGVLELADREFQAIQNADSQLSERAAAAVKRGELAGVEITPQALKLFLDGRLGADGRMKEYGYEWSAKLLKRLGFNDLKKVEAAISPYDDRQLSRIAENGLVGQLSRFEMMLLAALGHTYLQRHPWQGEEWFELREKRQLQSFMDAGIPTSTFSL